MRLLAALALLAGCSSERLDQLESRVTELKSENDRLARDLADLRRSGTTGTAAPAAKPDDRALELEAGLRAVLDHLDRELPATPKVQGDLPGVWRADELVVHYAPGGGLCGYRVAGGAAREKQPFWGRWERHGRILLELRDRWVGDHNEHDATLRTLAALTNDDLALEGADRLHFKPVPKDEWKKLASLYDDREVAIPGLPAWCFKP